MSQEFYINPHVAFSGSWTNCSAHRGQKAVDRSNAGFPFAATEHLGAVDGSATGCGHAPAFKTYKLFYVSETRAVNLDGLRVVCKCRNVRAELLQAYLTLFTS
jgi:hypothetical protein